MSAKKTDAERKPKRPAASGDNRAKPIKPRLPACRVDQQAATALFLDFLLVTAESTRDQYREVAQSQQNLTIEGTYRYWKNAVAIIKWAQTLNMQRKPVNG